MGESSQDQGRARHLDRFLDCIEGNGENPCDVVSAVTVTRITLKLLESIRLGQPLPIGQEDRHVPAVCSSSSRCTHSTSRGLQPARSFNCMHCRRSW
jgi:hypothetical protein